MIIKANTKFKVCTKRNGTEEFIQSMESLCTFDPETVHSLFSLTRTVLLKTHGYELHDFTHKSRVCSYIKWLIHYGYAKNVFFAKGEEVFTSFCVFSGDGGKNEVL